MLPSLSKHFIKAMLKPIRRGPTQEEVHAVMPLKPMSVGAREEWRLKLITLFARRGPIVLGRPMGATPTKEQVVAAYRAM